MDARRGLRRALSHSPYRDVVRRLYRGAGLDLNADLDTLDAGATIGADPAPSRHSSRRPYRPESSRFRSSHAHDRGPARPRPARERLRGRRPARRSQQPAAAGVRRPLGPLHLHTGRVRGGRRGAHSGSRRVAGAPSPSRRRCRPRRAPSASGTRRSCTTSRPRCRATTARSTRRETDADIEPMAATVVVGGSRASAARLTLRAYATMRR